jgi:hypothetical protein
VFYDKGAYSDGWRYLEAAPPETEFFAWWGPDSTMISDSSRDIGLGKRNTLILVNQFRLMGYAQTAAQLCADIYVNGYTDWFLPSMEELTLMYINLKRSGFGNFTDSHYWSSWEWNYDAAAGLNFYDGNEHVFYKGNSCRVRAIRVF